METIKNLLSGSSKHEETNVGDSGSSAITGGSSQPGQERRADPTTGSSQYGQERRADLTTESGSHSTGQHGIGSSTTSTGDYGSNHNAQNSQYGAGTSGFSETESQRGTGLSEATTDQTGRNLLTGAGIVDSTSGNTSSQTTSSANRDPITHSGNQHGSGRELGGSAAAGVTPGFANNAHETSERSFPLSGNTATTSSSHLSNTNSGIVGRDTAALGSAGIIGDSHHHHHHDNERELGSSTTENTSSHVGRDAAALGTAGVIGEGNHHHRENERGLGFSTTGSSGAAISDTGRAFETPQYGQAGHHSTLTANLLDPNLQGGVGHEDHVTHHKKRGGGAEQADAYHSPQLSSTKGTLTRDDALQSTSANAVGVDEFDPSTTGRSGFTTETSTHHLGRDAAVVSGVGGAAYAAEHQHKHDKDLSEAEHEAKRQQKHTEKEARKEHHHEPAVTHDSSHTTRNTALATTDPGGAYVTDKRSHTTHDADDTTSPSGKKDIGDHYHGQDRNRGVVGSSGFPGEPGFGDGTTHVKRDWRETVRQAQADYGVGPDAQPLPLDKKPVGSDYGDHLHGTRNRGVVGESGIPGESGFGSGKATGPGVGPLSSESQRTEPAYSQAKTGLPTRSRGDEIPRSYDTTTTNTTTTTSTTGHHGHSHHLDANGTPRNQAASESIGNDSGVANAGGNTYGSSNY